jgi:hypothetical protein
VSADQHLVRSVPAGGTKIGPIERRFAQDHIVIRAQTVTLL